MSCQRNSRLRLFFCALMAGTCVAGTACPARASDQTEIETGFHLLYEAKFPEARAQFFAWEKAHPDDPLGSTAEAAGYLFEEFYVRGVLTSEFFLDDKLLLGGATGKTNETRCAAFLAANKRALDLAQRQLKSDVPERNKALFRFAQKLTQEPFAIKDPDILELRRHGWDDAAILEASLVASHSNFLNRLASALGLIPQEVF